VHPRPAREAARAPPITNVPAPAGFPAEGRSAEERPPAPAAMSPSISPRLWAALLLAGPLPALARPAAAIAAPGCGAAKKGWQFCATSSGGVSWKWAWDASGNGEIDCLNFGWPAAKTVSGCRYQCSQDECCTFVSRAAAAAGARAHAGRVPFRPKPRLTLRSLALRSGRTRPGQRAARAPRGEKRRSERRSPPARPRG
jgi:hypothetical protein